MPASESTELIAKHHYAIMRFDTLLSALVDVYALPKGIMNIFYDMPEESQMISFNRNGNIFLNLRYYEAWRESYTSIADALSLTSS